METETLGKQPYGGLAGTSEPSHDRSYALKRGIRALDRLPTGTLARVAEQLERQGVAETLDRVHETEARVFADMEKQAQRAVGAQGLTLENVEQAFTWQPWDREQKEQGDQVREALIAAVRTVLRVVPPSPARTRALNELLDARLHANTAITWRGLL